MSDKISNSTKRTDTMKTVRSYCWPVVVGGFYLFLYIPILILVVFSFNKNALTHDWTGFTMQWYYDLFASEEMWQALKNSFFIASVSVFLSLAIGAMMIFFGTRRMVDRLQLLFYGNLAMPEIVLAVGLLSLFVLFSIPLGATTLIAGHTLLGLGYVVPILYARFVELDKSLIEASYDLGATQRQTFFLVVLPLLSPALIASGLLAFIISLDDFVISFFCAGASVQTLPLYIFSVIRSGSTPMVNALSTVLLVGSSLLVILFSLLQAKKFGITQ